LDSEMSVEEVEAKYGNPKKLAGLIKMTYFLDKDEKAMQSDEPVAIKSRLKTSWMIIIGLFATPILIPLAFGLLATFIGILIAATALLFSAYVLVIALLAGGLFVIGAGISVVLQSWATTVTFVGAGLIMSGIGLILTPYVLKFTKWLFNKTVDFIKWVGRKVTRKQHADFGGGY
jgi:uncharacterized membrane protein